MGKVKDPKCPGLNPLCGLIFLHIPSILYTQPILSYLFAFLQGVLSSYISNSYSSLQSKYKITSFPLMLQLEALSLKILFTSPMTSTIFSLALAIFVTYTSPLCYCTIISLKIWQIHLHPCLLHLWKKTTTYHTFVALKMELPLTK